MRIRFQQTVLLLVYQLMVTVGIALMPVAVLTRRLGVHLPFGQIVESFHTVIERSRDRTV